MYINVTPLAEGPGPSERLIGIKARDGEEQVIVSRRVLRDDSIDVGLALSEENGYILIELPRESTRGRWRIWVSEDEIIRSSLEAAE